MEVLALSDRGAVFREEGTEFLGDRWRAAMKNDLGE